MALCLFDSGSLLGFCSLYWNLETCTLENVGQRWFLSWTRFREFLTIWSFKIFTDNSTNSLCVTSIRSMDSTLKALQVRSMVTISNSLSLAARDHDSCSPISRAAFRQGGFSGKELRHADSDLWNRFSLMRHCCAILENYSAIILQCGICLIYQVGKTIYKRILHKCKLYLAFSFIYI